MVEKQTSSEIAESRVFDKLIVRHDRGEFGVPTSWNAMRGMLAEAERDTRERCVQERKELLKNLTSAIRKVLPSQLLRDVIDHCDPLSAFLREIGEKSLAEHIRGKEVSR